MSYQLTEEFVTCRTNYINLKFSKTSCCLKIDFTICGILT